MPAHFHYRQQWVDAGYISAMGSAWVTPPPPPDFLRVYHFTSAEHAITDISLARLKVARFSEVNDPFELLALNFTEGRVRKVIRAFKDAHNSQTGLLSFSRNWTNPVLWSHYADKHRGICLGFDVPRNRIHHVRYEDKRILAELDKQGEDPTRIPADLQEKLFCTKSAHWEYEEEVRLMVDLAEALSEGSIHFYPIGGDLVLKEVILGPSCELPLQKARALARTRHGEVAVCKARLAFKFFAIVPIEHTIP
jgi:hypothetical protein